MNRHLRLWLGLIALVVALPSLASAQSTLSGRVADDTGAVLPGVTVEATSPVLIEKLRVAVTDAEGRFTLTDLRPGVYTVTFSLPGFGTLRQEGIQLAADVTTTVNGQLAVGAIEEAITVQAAAPVVDVQRAARTTVITRATADIIPTGRDFKALAATLPSVKTSNQNVGGTRTVTQQGISVHGLARNNTTKYIDGLNTNTAWSEGGVQMYDNDAMAEETSYSLSSATADTSAGGVRVNVIPREGGNTFNGSMFLGHIHGGWQGDNVTQELIDRGLRGTDATEYISDLNLSAGGPILRDRLWVFLSLRRIDVDVIKPNTFHADGRPGHEVNLNWNYSGRLTAQITPRNKFTAYLDRVVKTADQVLTPGTDPDTAAGRRYPSLYYIGQAKWTVPLNQRTLIEAGVSIPVMAADIGYKPEDRLARFSPEWFAGARREDIVLGTNWAAYSSDVANNFYRYHYSGSVSYVTGSHSFKTGVQFSHARNTTGRDNIADLIQRYRSGVPDSVQVFNTPVLSTDLLTGDTGFYVMDSWTLNRLTVNPGVRLEWFKGAIGATSVGQGRFVSDRSFPEVTGMPDWFDVAPRFSAAYDLFGNGNTALKFGVNKYMEAYVTSIAGRYNPMVVTNDIRNWRDVDFIPGTSTPSGRVLPTNGDDIAQDNEIGPSNDRFFGTRPSRRPADDLKREFNREYTISVQHQLFPGIGVTAGWYRRTFHNLVLTDNVLLTSSDYVPFEVVNPLTGETFTAYNLNRAKQGQIELVDLNSPDSNKRRRTYDGTELGANVRLSNGATLFGAWTSTRDVSVNCDQDDPNTLRFCDQRGLIPFRHDFKLSGSYPLPYDFLFGFSIQSYAGATAAGRSNEGDGSLGVIWNIPANLFPGGRTQTVNAPLIPPGVKYPDRHNQVDMSFKRTFNLRGDRVTIQPTLSLYNVFNGNNVFTEVQTFGSALGRPDEILQGRAVQLAAHMRF